MFTFNTYLFIFTTDVQNVSEYKLEDVLHLFILLISLDIHIFWKFSSISNYQNMFCI